MEDTVSLGRSADRPEKRPIFHVLQRRGNVINTTQDRLTKFLESETLMLTVNGALGRNPTYRANVDEDRKKKFQDSLRSHLKARLEEYRVGQMGDDRHVANIKALSSGLSECHREILIDGRFRIGAAQKALNLYLKYAWARGIIPEPPHCPIDAIVLGKIKKCPKSARCRICPTPWTKIDTTQEYRHFIEKAKAVAERQGQSLAKWELGIWEDTTHRNSLRCCPEG